MPYATNPKDGVRTYFEDSGREGPPVLVYPGFTDAIAYAKEIPVVRALADEFRLIYADHRGQGGSDKPHDVEAYALPARIGDAVAILDALSIDRAHFFGSSWGARLGFALGEHAPERVRSLVLYGNQPYQWPRGPMVHGVAEAVAAGKERGINALVETWEAAIGEPFPEPGRSSMLENDPIALEAAFRSAMAEGSISADLSRWRVPCFIYVGADDEMRPGAERAAAEIPGARFHVLAGYDHFSAERILSNLLPPILEVIRSA